MFGLYLGACSLMTPLTPHRAGAGRARVAAWPRMALAEGDEVLVVGRGAVMLLAAKMAASKGFKTTVLIGDDKKTAETLVGDEAQELPLSMLPVAGDDVDETAIEAAVNGASGVIIAFDGEEVAPQAALNVFMPTSGGQLKHVSVLSKNLNGDGMGFFAKAAKTAANAEIWAGEEKKVEAYRDMETRVLARAAEVGASHTIIRVGTLKGGGCGSSSDDGGGDDSFLKEFFYTLGQQDVVNWRMLFDCDTLGVTLKRGDTMPGPGTFAAWSATSPDACAGDSGRGGAAAALVEALRLDAAANADFGVGTAQGRAAPTAEEWKALFSAA